MSDFWKDWQITASLSNKPATASKADHAWLESFRATLPTGAKVTVGPPFYMRATGPLFAALMLLMGIAPLSAWGHSTMMTLGRAIWKSALAALVLTILLFFSYTKNLIALTGFFLIALVLAAEPAGLGRPAFPLGALGLGHRCGVGPRRGALRPQGRLGRADLGEAGLPTRELGRDWQSETRPSFQIRLVLQRKVPTRATMIEW